MLYYCYRQNLVDCSSSHQWEIGCSTLVDQWHTQWRCSDAGHREVFQNIPCNLHRDGSSCRHEFWFAEDNLGSEMSLYQRIDDGRCRDIRAWWLLVNWLVNPGKKRGRVNALVILIIIKKYYLERIAIVIMYIDIRVSLVGVGVDAD